MTVGDISLLQAYDYLVYPIGALNFGVKSGVDGSVVYESSNPTTADALGALQYCRDQAGATGKSIWLKAGGYYPISATLSFTAPTHQYQSWMGLGGPYGKTRIHASGNYPAVEFGGGTQALSLQDLYFTHNTAGYSSSLVHFKDTNVEVCMKGLRFEDFGNYAGNAIGFELVTNTTQQYKIILEKVVSNGFTNFMYVNMANATTSSNNFISSLIADKIFAWNCKRVLKVDGVSGSELLAASFQNIHSQYNTANPLSSGESVYEFAGGSASSWFIRMLNNHIWDIPSTSNMANMGSSSEVAGVMCNLSDKVGGTGAAKYKQWDYYTQLNGTSTLTGNGIQTDFVITHNLNKVPKYVLVTNIAADMNTVQPFTVPDSLWTTTQFTIKFKRPLGAGTNNAKVYWRVFY